MSALGASDLAALTLRGLHQRSWRSTGLHDREVLDASLASEPADLPFTLPLRLAVACLGNLQHASALVNGDVSQLETKTGIEPMQ